MHPLELTRWVLAFVAALQSDPAGVCSCTLDEARRSLVERGRTPEEAHAVTRVAIKMGWVVLETAEDGIARFQLTAAGRSTGASVNRALVEPERN